MLETKRFLTFFSYNPLLRSLLINHGTVKHYPNRCSSYHQRHSLLLVVFFTLLFSVLSFLSVLCIQYIPNDAGTSSTASPIHSRLPYPGEVS
ncbi:MAG: hypothetical protein ACTSWN_05675 [Promethearchaeota archaeon]